MHMCMYMSCCACNLPCNNHLGYMNMMRMCSSTSTPTPLPTARAPAQTQRALCGHCTAALTLLGSTHSAQAVQRSHAAQRSTAAQQSQVAYHSLLMCGARDSAPGVGRARCAPSASPGSRPVKSRTRAASSSSLRAQSGSGPATYSATLPQALPVLRCGRTPR